MTLSTSVFVSVVGKNDDVALGDPSPHPFKNRLLGFGQDARGALFVQTHNVLAVRDDSRLHRGPPAGLADQAIGA